MVAGAAKAIIIYALCDPATEEVRYVGKTWNLAIRMSQHMYESKWARNHRSHWIRNLGVKPLARILEVVPSDAWVEAERRWILHFRTSGARLTNGTDGGDQNPIAGKHHTEDAVVRMRLAAMKDGRRPPSRKGCKLSDETRAKMSATRLRLGTRPPNMGGWNKGVRNTQCGAGHLYSLETSRLYYRKDRNRTHQICGICENERLRRWALKEEVQHR